MACREGQARRIRTSLLPFLLCTLWAHIVAGQDDNSPFRCDPNEYKTAEIVLSCTEGEGEVELILQKAQPVRLAVLPAGLSGFRLTFQAGVAFTSSAIVIGDADGADNVSNSTPYSADLWLADGECLLISPTPSDDPNCPTLSDASPANTTYLGMEIQLLSGYDYGITPPLSFDFAIRGNLTRDLDLYIRSRNREGVANVSFAQGSLSPCPEVLPGCATSTTTTTTSTSTITTTATNTTNTDTSSTTYTHSSSITSLSMTSTTATRSSTVSSTSSTSTTITMINPECLQYQCPAGYGLAADSPVAICYPASNCSEYTCPAGFTLHEDPDFLLCAFVPCAVSDSSTCCAASTTVTTATTESGTSASGTSASGTSASTTTVTSTIPPLIQELSLRLDDAESLSQDLSYALVAACCGLLLLVCTAASFLAFSAMTRRPGEKDELRAENEELRAAAARLAENLRFSTARWNAFSALMWRHWNRDSRNSLQRTVMLEWMLASARDQVASLRAESERLRLQLRAAGHRLLVRSLSAGSQPSGLGHALRAWIAAHPTMVAERTIEELEASERALQRRVAELEATALVQGHAPAAHPPEHLDRIEQPAVTLLPLHEPLRPGDWSLLPAVAPPRRLPPLGELPEVPDGEATPGPTPSSSSEGLGGEPPLPSEPCGDDLAPVSEPARTEPSPRGTEVSVHTGWLRPPTEEHLSEPGSRSSADAPLPSEPSCSGQRVSSAASSDGPSTSRSATEEASFGVPGLAEPAMSLSELEELVRTRMLEAERISSDLDGWQPGVSSPHEPAADGDYRFSAETELRPLEPVEYDVSRPLADQLRQGLMAAQDLATQGLGEPAENPTTEPTSAAAADHPPLAEQEQHWQDVSPAACERPSAAVAVGRASGGQQAWPAAAPLPAADAADGDGESGWTSRAALPELEAQLRDSVLAVERLAAGRSRSTGVAGDVTVHDAPKEEEDDVPACEPLAMPGASDLAVSSVHERSARHPAAAAAPTAAPKPITIDPWAVPEEPPPTEPPDPTASQLGTAQLRGLPLADLRRQLRDGLLATHFAATAVAPDDSEAVHSWEVASQAQAEGEAEPLIPP